MQLFLKTLHRHKNDLISIPGVVSTGLGLKKIRNYNTGVMSLVVGVEKKLPRDQVPRGASIPRFINMIPTDVVEVGKINFLGFALPGTTGGLPAPKDDTDFRKSKVRPAVPGVSVGHYKTTAGTLGALVNGAFPGGRAILSNNHILANGTDGRDGRARVGDPIFQPGPYDGGTRKDAIASLSAYVPYQWISAEKAKSGQKPPVNYVDAALAIPFEPGVVEPKILGLGPVRGTTAPFPGTPVIKSGRSSGITRGYITSIHNTIYLEDEDRAFVFEDQIATTNMSDSGDSGALVLDPGGRAVGLLFAGSDRVTYANPIDRVLNALKVKI